MKRLKYIILLIAFISIGFSSKAQKQIITNTVDFYLCQQITLAGVQQIDEKGNPIIQQKDAQYYFYFTPKIKSIKLKNVWISNKNKNFIIKKSKENKIKVDWSDGINITTEIIIASTKYPIYKIIIKEDNKIRLNNKAILKNKDNELIISYYQNNILKYLNIKSIYQLPSIPMP